MRDDEMTSFTGKSIAMPTETRNWKEELEVHDMTPCIYKEYQIFEKLLNHARSKSDIPATLVEVTKCLANLCTNKLLRSEVLKHGGIDLLMKKAYSDNPLSHIPLKSLTQSDKDPSDLTDPGKLTS